VGARRTRWPIDEKGAGAAGDVLEWLVGSEKGGRVESRSRTGSALDSSILGWGLVGGGAIRPRLSGGAADSARKKVRWLSAE